jgi:hypothetical protein
MFGVSRKAQRYTLAVQEEVIDDTVVDVVLPKG